MPTTNPPMHSAALPKAETNGFDPQSAEAKLLAKLPERVRSDQVAALLNCTTQHVRQLREKGALAFIDIRSPGSRQATYRFYKGDLARYLAKLLAT